MPELQEGRYAGEFVVSEGNGKISRETIIVLSGETLEAGAVLGKVTASGKYKALDPAAVEPLQRRAQRAPADGRVGRDFRERHQHEGALEQARMRQGHVRVVDRHVIIGQNIDIERARPPAGLAVAVAAEIALDLVCAIEQPAR